jgi:PKD repeat protein
LLPLIVVLLLSIPSVAQTPPTAITSQKANRLAQNPNILKPPQAPTSPVLTLNANTQSTQPGQNIHFTANWNRTVYRVVYRFEWGDGQVTDTQGLEADHSYESAGAYTARVTATSTSAAIASRTPGISSNDVAIKVASPVSVQSKRKPPRALQSPPVLTLNAGLLAPSPNQNVHFTTSWDPQIYPENYRFEWGDGQSSDGQSGDAYHAYATPGTYIVRAVAQALVNDQTLGVRSNEVTITVALPIPPPPQAVVTLVADRREMRVGDAVPFTATVDPPASLVRYRFTFGDGTEQDSSSDRVVHAYEHAGNFQAIVTASIEGRDQGVSSQPLEVAIFAKEIPNLSVVPVSKDFFADRDTILQASLDVPIKDVRYEFDWGDGSMGNVVDITGRATHRYARMGSYTIVVTARSEKTYRVPLQKSLILNVKTPPLWPLTLGQWLLILAVAGAIVFSLRLINQKKATSHPTPGLHVYSFSDAGIHTVAHIDRSVSHVSLTLKPGMDSVEHNISFPGVAAASD